MAGLVLISRYRYMRRVLHARQGHRICVCFFFLLLPLRLPCFSSVANIVSFHLCHLDVLLIGSLYCRSGQSDVPQMSCWPIILQDAQFLKRKKKGAPPYEHSLLFFPALSLPELVFCLEQPLCLLFPHIMSTFLFC